MWIFFSIFSTLQHLFLLAWQKIISRFTLKANVIEYFSFLRALAECRVLRENEVAREEAVDCSDKMFKFVSTNLTGLSRYIDDPVTQSPRVIYKREKKNIFFLFIFFLQNRSNLSKVCWVEYRQQIFSWQKYKVVYRYLCTYKMIQGKDWSKTFTRYLENDLTGRSTAAECLHRAQIIRLKIIIQTLYQI